MERFGNNGPHFPILRAGPVPQPHWLDDDWVFWAAHRTEASRRQGCTDIHVQRGITRLKECRGSRGTLGKKVLEAMDLGGGGVGPNVGTERGKGFWHIGSQPEDFF